MITEMVWVTVMVTVSMTLMLVPYQDMTFEFPTCKSTTAQLVCWLVT